MGIIAEQWRVGEGVQLNVHRASGIDRLRGLIGREVPGQSCGWLFERCRCVHGIGMRVPLDVVFLDAAGVVRSIQHLAPMSVRWDRRASAALEFAAGEPARLGLRVGDRLKKLPTRGVNSCCPHP